MNETITLDEPTQDQTSPSADMQQVIAKAKNAFRTVVARDDQEGHADERPTMPFLRNEGVAPERPVAEPTAPTPGPEGAEHDAWFASLSDPQRRAYDAHQSRGLAMDEREKRDLLRAALALHPNREVAAEGVGSLRPPADRGAAPEEREHTEERGASTSFDHGEEPSLDLTSLVPDEAKLVNERAHQEAFERSVSRVESLAKEVREARSTHSAKYKALGLPELPKDSPRRKLLEQAAAPEREADASVASPRPFVQLDQRLRAMQKDIVDDPLWIAADYLDRTTSLEKVEDRVREDAGVQKAKEQYRGAEDRVRTAARALDEYTPRGRWQRALDIARRNGTSDQDRLRALHAAMKEASLSLNNAKREVERAEREARDEAQALNAQALEIQRDARATRDVLEQPLREALVERHMAGRALRDQAVPHHLRDARDQGSLTYGGERSISGFAFHEFSAFGGTTFLADAVETRSALEKLNLSPGDRVVMRSDEHGARHLQLDERCDPGRGFAGAKRAKSAERSRSDPFERAR